jgi:hypothetical protein
MSNENPGKEAGRALMSGFAGCLGVGLAILFVLVAVILFAVAVGHN